MGRGGAGVAAPCSDGSAMFFNPAGLAGLTGGRLTIGVTLLDVQGGFTDDVFQQKTKLDDPLLAIPQVYTSYAATPKLGIGVGLFAPDGLETNWPTAFDGRFAGYKNIIKSVYIQPTLAYQVSPQLSIGGGLDIVLGKVELNQRADLADALVPLAGVPAGTRFGQFGIAPGTDFANVHLEATKTTVAAHFGTSFKVSDRLSFGANFLTQAKFDYSGTATFTQVPTGLVVPAAVSVGALTIPAGTPIDGLLGGPPSQGGLDLFNPTTGVFRAQPVTTSIKNPSQLELGLAYKVGSGWTLLGDYQLTWWSQFNELDITFPQAPRWRAGWGWRSAPGLKGARRCRSAACRSPPDWSLPPPAAATKTCSRPPSRSTRAAPCFSGTWPWGTASPPGSSRGGSTIRPRSNRMRPWSRRRWGRPTTTPASTSPGARHRSRTSSRARASWAARAPRARSVTRAFRRSSPTLPCRAPK